MPQSISINRRIVLNSRPVGVPTIDNFMIENSSDTVPSDELGASADPVSLSSKSCSLRSSTTSRYFPCRWSPV